MWIFLKALNVWASKLVLRVLLLFYCRPEIRKYSLLLDKRKLRNENITKMHKIDFQCFKSLLVERT